MIKEQFDTAVIFCGQGGQHAGMGKDIYGQYVGVRQIFERASEVTGMNIANLCFEDPDGKLSHARFAQPAIVTLQVAGADVLREKGIVPSQVAGHSLGEISASVVAGGMSVEDGVRLAAKRGAWMEEQGEVVPGAMAASLGLGLEAVEEICEKTGTEVANVNSDTQIVIAGRRDLVASAAALIAEYRGKFRLLPIDVASHCSLMEPVREKIARFMREVEVRDPQIPLISNVTAKYVGRAIEIRDNLANQVASRVLWVNDVREMIKKGGKEFNIIGPGDALSGNMRRINPSVNVKSWDF